MGDSDCFTNWDGLIIGKSGRLIEDYFQKGSKMVVQESLEVLCFCLGNCMVP